MLLLSIISDHYGSPGAFYLYWIITGGLSGLKMVSFTIKPLFRASMKMSLNLTYQLAYVVPKLYSQGVVDC